MKDIREVIVTTTPIRTIINQIRLEFSTSRPNHDIYYLERGYGAQQRQNVPTVSHPVRGSSTVPGQRCNDAVDSTPSCRFVS